MSYTFAVDDVLLADALLDEVDYSRAVEGQIGSSVEACAWQHRPLVAVRFNGFVAAVHHAYQDHRPLVLSPDHLWLVLYQGLGDHVKLHAEALRHHFVAHEGRKELVIRRPDFQKGNPLDPWDEVITAWTTLIQKHVGEHHDLLTATFSTTGPIETTAFQIALMDVMQDYFSYTMTTLCGIPSITLEGTSDDWQQIQARIQRFRVFGLDWWVDALEDVIQEFVNASEGRVNLEFWQAFYKLKHVYGGHLVSGAILKLFPYTWDAQKKPHLNPYITQTPGPDKGLSTKQFPDGLSAAPFIFERETERSKMEVTAGFIGLMQNAETKALRPEIGWAVRDLDTLAAAHRERSRRNLERFGLSPEKIEEMLNEDLGSE